MSQSILVDSDILIDHLRKEKHALAFLSSEIEKGSFLFVSVISRIEILAGMRKGEEVAVGQLFELLMPIPVDEAIADRAGDYLRKYCKSHGLNIGDAIIAATAGEMSLNLATLNVKHYCMKDIGLLEAYKKGGGGD